MGIRFLMISLGFVIWGSFMKTETAPPFKLIVFEGSDWCKQCIAFEENVLTDSSFVQHLENWNIELERIDFPQRKKLSKEIKEYNKAVADKYLFDGIFPTILLSRTDRFTFKKISYSNFETSLFLTEIEHLLKELNPACNAD